MPTKQKATYNQKRSYSYDALNRITKAVYLTPHSMVNDFANELENYTLDKVSYDLNGNIMGLRRYGAKQNNSIGIIDQLDYTYYPSSNRLKLVIDTADDAGFKDGTIQASFDYAYDVNGNMVKDLNKGIFNIEYNHLNLPTKVEFDNTDPNSQTEKYIAYTYDATGVKLQKTVQIENVSNQNFTQYDNGFIYEYQGTATPELQFFPHAEGYVEPNGNNFDYIYQYKDHLGNIRLSYKDNNESLEIVEENNYYPFGLKHKGYNNVTTGNVNSVATKFKFQGVEHEEALGFNLYEMDFRNYDPALSRFTGIDPVTHHSMSPYVAFDNNPVYWVDPSGANAVDPINIKSTAVHSSVDNKNNTTITQSTTNSTITMGDDGSISIAQTTSSISNTVDADGNVINGNTVTESSTKINISADGEMTKTPGETSTRSLKDSDNTSALDQWTETVSEYNMNNDDTYNQNLIDTGGYLTTVSFAAPLVPIAVKTGATLVLPEIISETLNMLGVPSAISLPGALTGGGLLLTANTGSWNNYAIIYDVKQVANGNLTKDFKNSDTSRKNVGPSSFNDLFKASKWKEFFNGGK